MDTAAGQPYRHSLLMDILDSPFPWLPFQLSLRYPFILLVLLLAGANYTGCFAALAVGSTPFVEAAFRQFVLAPVAIHVVHPISSWNVFFHPIQFFKPSIGNPLQPFAVPSTSYWKNYEFLGMQTGSFCSGLLAMNARNETLLSSERNLWGNSAV